MRKQSNLALTLATIVGVTSTFQSPCLQANNLDPLVLTEVDPFTLIASIGDLSSAGSPIPTRLVSVGAPQGRRRLRTREECD
jgi:hypothetical protein